MTPGRGKRDLRAGPRQREVLSLLAAGLKDAQIGRELGISTATVRTYLMRLYRDNGFENRTEAAVAWTQSQGASSTRVRGHSRRQLAILGIRPNRSRPFTHDEQPSSSRSEGGAELGTLGPEY